MEIYKIEQCHEILQEAEMKLYEVLKRKVKLSVKDNEELQKVLADMQVPLHAQELIIDAVCTFYTTSFEELKGDSKKDKLPEARRVLFHFIRLYFPLISDAKIADMLEKDRTTAIYHLSTFKDHFEINRAFRNKMIQLNAIIERRLKNEN